MGMQEFIAKIAKGPKASKDLTWDEAKRAMRALIEGEATAAQVGAFLVAMRFKMESVTELASFTATARSYVAPLPIPQDVGVVDLPLCRQAGHLSRYWPELPSSPLLRAEPSSCTDMTAFPVVRETLPSSRPSVFRLISKPRRLQHGGQARVRIPGHCALSSSSLPVSGNEAGTRGPECVSSDRQAAEPGSRIFAGGRPHAPAPFRENCRSDSNVGPTESARCQGRRGRSRIVDCHGDQGIKLRDERISPLTLAPKDAGLRWGLRARWRYPPEQREKEADLLRRILHNQVAGGQRDWVLLNAGLLLYAGGRGASLAECTSFARRALEDGVGKKIGTLAQTPMAVVHNC